ncbi:MAG TPA: Tm-1-like ATP-binding domain-containing protein, partial [Chloroflexota bacterium]
SREEVADAAGSTPAQIGQLQRAERMQVMADGAARIASAMRQAGELHGIIGLGGGTGTWMASNTMRALPIGFPKLIVSTLAQHDARIDTLVMPSVADIAGLNTLLTPILANAAAAVCGMVEARLPPTSTVENRRSVAMTMFGVTTAGGTYVRERLERAGCEVVVFHANGNGGATMEDLVRRGMFAAVLDWTTTEVTDHLAGGVCDAGPTRLESASAVGIPQVIVPGAIDVINWRGALPERWLDRATHMHLPGVPLIRTSIAESRQIGDWMAGKLNQGSGPVHVLIPCGGFSALDIEGGPFWDPAADEAFVAALRGRLRPDIPVEEVADHINSEAFAKLAADALLGISASLFRSAPREVPSQ